MLEKNTKQVNQMLARIYARCTAAILILVLCSGLGIFEFGKNYTILILVAGLLLSITPSLLIRYLPDHVMKYYMLILVSIFIGILGTNNHIGVYITYILVPVFSCLYFEPHLVIKMGIFSYIVMAASLYVNSAQTYEVLYMGFPRMQMFIALLLGFTIEFVIVLVVLYFLVKRAKLMMEQRYSAEEENRMKSKFLSSMSHEIRTPMNAIIGMADVALREDMNDDLRKYIRIIKSSSTGLLEIINDILDLSKIEAGKLNIIEEDYTAQSLTEDITAIINARNTEKKVPIYYHIQENMPHILRGDVVRLKQVMLNYASNAIKYTDSGQIDVVISCQDTKDGYTSLVYTVKDTGTGIREEDMDKLFTMYSQLDPEKNHGKESTGIGLAISKSFIEKMHGTVSVESIYGKGSSFSFTVPQKIVQQSPTPEQSSKPDSAEAGTGKCETGTAEAEQTVEEESITEETRSQRSASTENDGFFATKNARILITDDNEINREVLKAILEPFTFAIDEAENGERAVQMAATVPYDLIFMDSHMPIMNGKEATKKIRETETCINRDTPIIAITADAIAGVREELLAAGMDDYIVKPIDMKQLCSVIRKHLPDDKILEQ